MGGFTHVLLQVMVGVSQVQEKPKLEVQHKLKSEEETKQQA